MSSVPEREELARADTWDLDAIYTDTDAWEAAFESVSDRLEALEAYEGRTTEDADTLLEVLELREELMREVAKLSAYARMRSDEDKRDTEFQALSNRGSSLRSSAASAASFIEPELQSLSESDLERLIAENSRLERYEQYFDDVLRMKPHTRSTDVESLLSEFSDVLSAPGDVYGMLTNADMTYPTVELPAPEDSETEAETVEITQSNLTTLLKTSDRAFRQTVHESFYDELRGVSNTIGTALAKSVKKDVKLARTRNYDTARQAAMNGPNIPVEVYDTLLETVASNLDTLHRHAELKQRALGVDTLEPWDVYMPLSESESPTIEYETACEYVVDALAPLGESYQTDVANGLDSRWVDVYENRGKRSGAYSGGTYDTQPYILMNYQDDVSSMFTLAHELGHSMHSEYTSESQPYVYSDYEIFVAEVASTVNETLLTHHLLDTVEDTQLRRHILNEYLERFRSTLFRQTMFADFEHQIHSLEEDGEALTAERFDDIYRDLKEDYYEPARIDDRIASEWLRIPHFFYNYYVYQYSTGISAAVALVEDIRSDGEAAAQRYREFLQKGSSAYPLEILEAAGVDMRSAEPIEQAIGVYDDCLDEMEALLAE